MMLQIPQVRIFDSTLLLALNGYRFISQQCQCYQTDIFQTRLLFKKTICFQGEEAARVFYDTEKFSRQGAAPKRLQKTLFGKDGVQGLDGDAHRHRKQMFMSLMSDKGIKQLADLTREQWYNYAQKWSQSDRVVLFEEAREILCRAACTWTGVPLSESEVTGRTKDLGAMIDGSGTVGLKHWQGRRSRKQVEKWIEDIIEQVRNSRLEIPEDRALYSIANHRDLEGNLLDKHTAAVEIINLIRPTVAIARYVIFAALALHEHPECRQKLQNGEDDYYQWFVQEVRRFYPFFPFAAAVVDRDFDWQDYHFPQGTKVLLDLYGTNHDPQLWNNAEDFTPERFCDWNGSKFALIPQGGGDYYTNHRCPGEWITIELMKVSLNFLTQSLQYDVPKQDLEIPLSTMPTAPKSGFVISNVSPS
ncbi:cytochrome P450 [Pleurocapsales cyanobacterium LEGE 10410]|nr:cytochrome P450 [Pleurocapsales cyanobacterium LEGE 10410]